jgi:predicted enzyme related to lactoylglutathione lyase
MLMRLSIDCVTVDCKDPQSLAAFWSAALDYMIEEDDGNWLVLRPEQGHGPRLGFQQVTEQKVVKNRMHLDLQSATGTTREAAVVRLEGLGARVIRLVVNGPDNAHMLMADPEGNEFCVI